MAIKNIVRNIVNVVVIEDEKWVVAGIEWQTMTNDVLSKATSEWRLEPNVHRICEVVYIVPNILYIL